MFRLLTFNTMEASLLKLKFYLSTILTVVVTTSMASEQTKGARCSQVLSQAPATEFNLAQIRATFRSHKKHKPGDRFTLKDFGLTAIGAQKITLSHTNFNLLTWTGNSMAVAKIDSGSPQLEYLSKQYIYSRVFREVSMGVAFFKKLGGRNKRKFLLEVSQEDIEDEEDFEWGAAAFEYGEHLGMHASFKSLYDDRITISLNFPAKQYSVKTILGPLFNNILDPTITMHELAHVYQNEALLKNPGVKESMGRKIVPIPMRTANSNMRGLAEGFADYFSTLLTGSNAIAGLAFQGAGYRDFIRNVKAKEDKQAYLRVAWGREIQGRSKKGKKKLSHAEEHIKGGIVARRFWAFHHAMRDAGYSEMDIAQLLFNTQQRLFTEFIHDPSRPDFIDLLKSEVMDRNKEVINLIDEYF